MRLAPEVGEIARVTVSIVYLVARFNNLRPLRGGCPDDELHGSLCVRSDVGYDARTDRDPTNARKGPETGVARFTKAIPFVALRSYIHGVAAMIQGTPSRRAGRTDGNGAAIGGYRFCLDQGALVGDTVAGDPGKVNAVFGAGAIDVAASVTSEGFEAASKVNGRRSARAEVAMRPSETRGASRPRPIRRRDAPTPRTRAENVGIERDALSDDEEWKDPKKGGRRFTDESATPV